MKKLVSVIIVNWNGKRFLRDCLSSLFSQDYKNIEVIFVDNASTDDSVEYVRRNFPKTKIKVNKENLGFAEANNIGYKQSIGDFVLFLNNDTRVTRNFLSELMKVLTSDKKIAGAQSKILLMDDSTKLDSVGAFLTNTGFLYHYGIAKKNSPKYNKQIDLYSAKGACMIFKKKVLEIIKVDEEIFDSRYFAYFEETDMCHRIWLAGYRIIFAPKSIIKHKMGGTSSRLNSGLVQYHSFKNRINSYVKNLSFITLLKILPLHILFCELISFVFLLEGKIDLFFAVNRAIFWNIKVLRETLLKRNYIQNKIRIERGDDFLRNISRKVGLSYYWYLFTGIKNYREND